MSLLIMQMALIKVTSVLLVLLVIILIFKHRKVSRRWWMQFSVLGSLFAMLFLAKNFIINGLPLFPVSNWSPFDVAWQLPSSVADFYRDITTAQAYGISYKDVEAYGFIDRFILWFNHAGVEGWFNKIVLLVLVSSFIMLMLKRRSTSIKIVFALFILQSSVLFLSSPQFRFFLNLLVPCGVLLVLMFIGLNKKWVVSISVLSSVLGFTMAFSTSFRNQLTDNRSMQFSQNSGTHLIFPVPLSRKHVAPILIKTEYFYHYDFETNGNIFPTYDLPLPAVQSRLIELLKEECGVRPEMITKNLKDGFKAVATDQRSSTNSNP